MPCQHRAARGGYGACSLPSTLRHLTHFPTPFHTCASLAGPGYSSAEEHAPHPPHSATGHLPTPAHTCASFAGPSYSSAAERAPDPPHPAT
eukprot:351233-Chlamydomonas_euryale.AAC.1